MTTSELACPHCGTAMVRRKRRSDRSEFWGCPNFPGCRGTRPIEAIAAVRPDGPRLDIANAVPWDDPSWKRSEAGASARATYARRLERHRERVRARRPQILLRGGVITFVGFALTTFDGTWPLLGWALVVLGPLSTLVRLFVAPAHVQAWAIGAAGEERLASRMVALEAEGFVVLHDLRIPGARENIDHLLIGPPGVFVIETKSYEGAVRVRGGELRIGGRRRTGFFDQVERQVQAVEAALDNPGVRGFICVLRGDFPLFGHPSARGIDIVPPAKLLATIRSLPAVLEPPEIERLTDMAARRLQGQRPRHTLREELPTPGGGGPLR